MTCTGSSYLIILKSSSETLGSREANNKLFPQRQYPVSEVSFHFLIFLKVVDVVAIQVKGFGARL
jgi:hypothetical protein